MSETNEYPFYPDRDEIIKDLNQDLVEEIEKLKDHIKWLLTTNGETMNNYKDMMFDESDFKEAMPSAKRKQSEEITLVIMQMGRISISLPIELYKRSQLSSQCIFLEHKTDKYLYELRDVSKGGDHPRVVTRSGNKAIAYFSIDLSRKFQAGKYRMEAFEKPNGLFLSLLEETWQPSKKLNVKGKSNETTSDVNETETN